MILFSWASKSVCSSVRFRKLRNLLSLAIFYSMNSILSDAVSGFDLVRSFRGIEQSDSNNPSVVFVNYSTHGDNPHLRESASSVDFSEESLREFVTDSSHNDRSLAWCNCKTFCRVKIKASISISLLFRTNCIVREFFESNFHLI